MTAVKGFEESRNRDEQRNIQYLLHKDFAIKGKKAVEKAVRKTILPCEKKRHLEKSFSSLLLDRFNSRN